MSELSNEKIKSGGAVSGDEQLFAMLKRLGIAYETIEHEPLFTVEQARKLRDQIPSGHAKNLFLKDNKKQIWLFVVHADTRVELKTLAKKLQAPGLHFAQSNDLMNYLGVTPGSVTPFGLLNDYDHVVRVLLDKELLAHNTVGIHPLRNNATTIISIDALQQFIRACGNEMTLFDFSAIN